MSRRQDSPTPSARFPEWIHIDTAGIDRAIGICLRHTDQDSSSPSPAVFADVRRDAVFVSQCRDLELLRQLTPSAGKDP